jgi:NTE family protein
LLPAFPPVAIAGRLLSDAGLSVNLPLDVVLSERSDHPLLCVTVDLFPLEAPWPVTLGDAAIRFQDLLFATQGRRALAAWQALSDARGEDARAVTLLRLSYRDQSQEVSGKTFDFSRRSAAGRWRAGYEDMTNMIAALARGEIQTGDPGLSIYQRTSGTAAGVERVRWKMQPSPA